MTNDQRLKARATEASQSSVISHQFLLINGFFWSTPHVGSGQYLHGLLPALADLAPDERRALAVMGEAEGVAPGWAEVVRWRPPLQAAGVTADALKTWFEQVVFPRLAQMADLAHVPYFAPPLRPAVPTVVTVHDLIPLVLPQYRGSPLARLYFRLVTLALPRAAHVITDSDYSRREILARFPLPPDRVTTVHLAAAERFRPASAAEQAAVRARYGLPDQFILYLAGFDVRKDVQTLLRAYADLQRQGVAVPLVCAGGLPRDSAVTPDPRRQAAELGLNSVLFPGWIRSEDQPALLSAATVFCFPSRYEGFGLPPLEAMACGTPTIVADATSLPEVVGDAALMHLPGDWQTLAEALRRLLTDADLRADLRQRGLARAGQFSWTRVAAETRAVYQHAVNRF